MKNKIAKPNKDKLNTNQKVPTKETTEAINEIEVMEKDPNSETFNSINELLDDLKK